MIDKALLWVLLSIFIADQVQIIFVGLYVQEWGRQLYLKQANIINALILLFFWYQSICFQMESV